MDTLAFLKRVLPTKGLLCSYHKPRKPKYNRFFDTVEELATDIANLDRAGQDAYYALSTFEDGHDRLELQRLQRTVVSTKVVPLDLDCGPGKEYADQRAAAKALREFIKAQNLPKPLLVNSGNGLHAYWVFDKTPAADDRKLLAKALVEAAKTHGLKADYACTIDTARVLRPVGTHNYKDPANPKPVTLLYDGGDVSYGDLYSALKYYVLTARAQEKAKSGLNNKLAVAADSPPAVGGLIYNKCAQIKWAADNPNDVPEPLWYKGVIGVSAYCEGGEETAIAWSQGHAAFSETETRRKVQQWIAAASGPPLCSTLEDERPSGCKDCPFKGKISSPIQLGVRHAEVDTSAEAPQAAETGVPLPKGYKRTSKGIMQLVDDTEIVVLPYDIYPVSYGRDDILKYEVVQYMWKRPHVGWTELTFRQACLAHYQQREFATVLADQGIVLGSLQETAMVQAMLKAYMDELRRHQAMSNSYSTMGWKEDGRVFVWGNTLFQNDNGTVTETVMRSSGKEHTLEDSYGTRGSLDEWKSAVEYFNTYDVYHAQCAIGMAIGSLLMEYTGLGGALVSYYGPSGTGKSQSQIAAQSIFGRPKELHFQSRFTENAIYQRCGAQKNLIMTIDEATQIPVHIVGDMAYTLSGGREKARLTKNAEQRTINTWSLITMVSTNSSLVNKLDNNGYTEDAQRARVLEFKIDANPLYDEASGRGREIHNVLARNYGHAGREVIRYLMQLGEEGRHALVKEGYDRFGRLFDREFSGVERFIEAVTVLTYLGNCIAKKLGLVSYSPRACMERWMLPQVDHMKVQNRELRQDVYDLMVEFVNLHMHEALSVYNQINGEKICPIDTVPRGTIRMRMDYWRRMSDQKVSNGAVWIDRTHLRKWFSERNADMRELLARLEKDGALVPPTGKRWSLAKGVAVRTPPREIVAIDLRHPYLEGILDTADVAINTPKTYEEWVKQIASEDSADQSSV